MPTRHCSSGAPYLSPELHPGRSFTNDVIVLDGMWGTGKSILSSLIGSLEGVEKKKLDHVFEYVCIGSSLGSVSHDFAVSMVRVYADLDQYNNLIAREVNLRPGDDSGFRNTPGSFKYLRRLFGPEGDVIVDRINRENLALLLVSHHLSAVSRPMFDALGTRLYLVEVLRHPLQLVKYWTQYFEDFERSREFTLGTMHSGTRVPWFAMDWCERFVMMKPIDRAVASINQLQSASLNQECDAVKASSTLIRAPLLIPFEALITETTTVLADVSRYVGRGTTSRTTRAMKRQRVPRSLSDRGRKSNSRSWVPNTSITYRDQLDQIRDWIRTTGSAHSQVLIDEAVTQYESRFPVVAELSPRPHR